MIISKIYNSLNSEQKEGLVWGLAGGLAWGLVVGLAGGLAWGLVWGLAWGLVAGLAGGLAWGLVWGLAGGLVAGLMVILINWSEALPFLTGIYPIVLVILGIIILSEILFWLMPKEKVKKKELFCYTYKRKIENIFEVLMILSGIAQVYILIREGAKYYNVEVTHFLLKWIGYIGAGIVILALIALVFYVWIKLNSLKYEVKK